jgi:hypothetical protein
VHSLLLLALAGLDLEAPAPEAQHAVIYGYPISTLAMSLRSTVAGEWAADIPLGASFRVTDTTAVDVEALWMTLGHSGSTEPAGWALSVAAGPSFKLWRGLYADAHARFTLYHSVLTQVSICPPGVACALDGLNGPGDLGPGRARAFTAEFDIGYAWTFGRLYLSPAIGIGAGYAFDYVDPTHVGLLTPFSARSTARSRPDGFVWTLNLNLLRVGVAL